MSTGTIARSDEITLEEPSIVRVGERVYRASGNTYRILKHVLGTKGKATTVRALAVAVWGKDVGPEVGKTTVKVALHRANEVLAGLAAREVLTLDGEAVLLL